MSANLIYMYYMYMNVSQSTDSAILKGALSATPLFLFTSWDVINQLLKISTQKDKNKQNKAKQSKAKQSKAKQNKTNYLEEQLGLL